MLIFDLDDGLKETYNRLFTACKTGDVNSLMAVLQELRDDAACRSLPDGDALSWPSYPPVSEADESPLSDDGRQRPSDRTDTSKEMPSVEAVLNRRLGRQTTTLLHVASEAGHRGIIWVLLANGADPAIRYETQHIFLKMILSSR